MDLNRMSGALLDEGTGWRHARKMYGMLLEGSQVGRGFQLLLHEGLPVLQYLLLWERRARGPRLFENAEQQERHMAGS